MMSRLYLFDIDGTLVSTGGAGIKSMNMAFQECLGISQALGNFDFSGCIDHDIFIEIFCRFQGKPPQAKELDCLKHTYIQHLKREIKISPGFCVHPGIREWLTCLAQDSEAVIGLATGNLEAGADIKIGFANLKHFFLFGGYGDQGTNRTVLIDRAIKNGMHFAGSPFGRIFVIGDSKHDIVSGREAGGVTVGVATGRASADELAQYHPDYLFNDFSDFKTVHETLKKSP